MRYIENELPKGYKLLFDAVEKALESMDDQNYGIAKQLLIVGQLKAEAAFVAEGLQQDVAEEPADSGKTGSQAAAED